MNREIEFRGKFQSLQQFAKPTNEGQWVYGCLVREAIFHCNSYIDSIYTTSGEVIPVYPHTVGQFTGMTDRYGKKIFEGDILLWTRKSVHIEGRPIQDFSDKCVIYYDNDKCGFRFRCKLDCGSCVGSLDFSDDRAKESYIEVIGSIYDNPELLNKE